MIDWEKAPHWANYAAMDADGIWLWYSNLPTPDGNRGWIERFGEYQRMAIQLPRATDWTQSLVYRPARQTPASVTKERTARYGSFEMISEISQGFKDLAKATPNWDELDAAQKEALEMIFHKIARLLNGDVKYLENARDISGYASIMLDAMSKLDGATDAKVSNVKRVNGVWVND